MFSACCCVAAVLMLLLLPSLETEVREEGELFPGPLRCKSEDVCLHGD